MKAKHEDLIADRMFYVFVDVGVDESSPVSFFVLPSNVVAKVCELSHAIWLAIPNAKGASHKDSEMRRLLPKYELPKYARKQMHEPSPLHKDFLNLHGEGWLEHYRSVWDLIGDKV
jgi:hypothetical protein